MWLLLVYMRNALRSRASSFSFLILLFSLVQKVNIFWASKSIAAPLNFLIYIPVDVYRLDLVDSPIVLHSLTAKLLPNSVRRYLCSCSARTTRRYVRRGDLRLLLLISGVSAGRGWEIFILLSALLSCAKGYEIQQVTWSVEQLSSVRIIRLSST